MADERFLGVDLGTTNSVAAISDGERAEFVRHPDEGTLLPSVVRFDGRGQVTVGARARKMLEADPDNTRGEFKRLMGSGKKLSFRSAALEKSPEELSGLVLGTLRRSRELDAGACARRGRDHGPGAVRAPADARDERGGSARRIHARRARAGACRVGTHGRLEA